MKFKNFISLFIICSCSQKNSNPGNINGSWLDSIINHSDSSYTKPYYRTDFATAEYYLSKKDSTLCQLMKDSAGLTRQVIIVKNEVRKFFGQYYKNGQLQATLPLDEFGQYHGLAEYYNVKGSITSSGNYVHGFKQGPWKNYDEKGKLIAEEEYDSNGGLINTILKE